MLAREDIELIEEWGKEFKLNTRSKILEKIDKELFAGKHLKKEAALTPLIQSSFLVLLSVSIVLAGVFL